MRILLLGKNGQVGWELQRALAPLGDVVSLDRNNGGDLTEVNDLANIIERYAPQVVVNAAAYTAVDKAESEQDLALLINYTAVKSIAETCKSMGALLVHYSTDYVFNGDGCHFWSESDKTNPINAYGQSKYLGEQAIQASGCDYLVFRTSWVYGAKGANFAKTMLKLARSRKQLSIIDDQIGAPTGADLIADVTAHAIVASLRAPEKQGLYHLVASGNTTWFDYATFVFDEARAYGQELKIETINAIASSEYPTPAARPKNSRLNCQKLESTFELTLPNWKLGVSRMLEEILEETE